MTTFFVIKVLPARKAISTKWHAGLVTVVAVPAVTPAAWISGGKLRKRKKVTGRKSFDVGTFGTNLALTAAVYPSFLTKQTKSRKKAKRYLLDIGDIFGPLAASPAVYASLFKPKAKRRNGKRRLLELPDVFTTAAPIPFIFAAVDPVERANRRSDNKRKALKLLWVPVFPVSPPSPLTAQYIGANAVKSKKRKNKTNRIRVELDSVTERVLIVAVTYPALINQKATRRKAGKRDVWLLSNPIYPQAVSIPEYASLIQFKASFRKLTNRELRELGIPPEYPLTPPPAGDATPPAYRTVIVYGPYSVIFKA